tara:strand:- start:176 stop:391 length:216 start_codon:yes stop_codon:yes gene_type:complete
MNLTAINQLQARAAKPWTNEELKRQQDADIKRATEEFLANGNEIKELPGFGVEPKHFTYKQKNDSTHEVGL